MKFVTEITEATNILSTINKQLVWPTSIYGTIEVLVLQDGIDKIVQYSRRYYNECAKKIDRTKLILEKEQTSSKYPIS